MKTKILVIALIISLGINIGGLLTLGYHRWGSREISHRTHDRRRAFPGLWKNRLDLTEEQLQAMDRLHEKMFDRMSPLREELSEKRRSLLELLKSQEYDGAQLDSLVGEIADLQAELEMGMLHDIREIMETMNEEQKAQFFERFEKRLLEGDRHPFPRRRRF